MSDDQLMRLLSEQKALLAGTVILYAYAAYGFFAPGVARWSIGLAIVVGTGLMLYAKVANK